MGLIFTNQVRSLRQGKNLSDRLDGWFLSSDASPPSLALVSTHNDQGSRIRKDWPALKFKVSGCDRKSSDLSLWAEYMFHFQASCYTTVAIAAYERLAFSAKDINSPYVSGELRYQPSNSITCHNLHCSSCTSCCVAWKKTSNEPMIISDMPRKLTSKTQVWILSWLDFPNTASKRSERSVINHIMHDSYTLRCKWLCRIPL